MIERTTRGLWAGMALALVVTAAAPAAAQTSNDEARLRKLESEVRALQRKVFPGGDPRFFEPEISAPGQPATVTTPSTTAVTDILMRLDALEAQIASLTAQTEQNSNGLVQLTTRVVALENGAAQPGTGETATAPNGGSTTDTNLAAMTGGASAAGTTSPAKATPSAASTPAPTQAAATAPSKPATGPSAARLAAVQQIAKPQTDDPADDEYSYGYRLWNAGFYPEAQQQLAMYVEKYPSHWRISYGRNLLGRAYFDDGKVREAAAWFLKNYQTDKQADRAPDSLLYLAESMIVLKDTNRACIALAEFGETYPAIATGRLATQYQGDLKKVKCN